MKGSPSESQNINEAHQAIRHDLRRNLSKLYVEQVNLMRGTALAVIFAAMIILPIAAWFLDESPAWQVLTSLSMAAFGALWALWLERMDRPRIAGGVLACGLHVAVTVFMLYGDEPYSLSSFVFASIWFCVPILASGLIGGVWASLLGMLYASMMIIVTLVIMPTEIDASPVLMGALAIMPIVAIGTLSEGGARLIRRITLRLPPESMMRVQEIFFVSPAGPRSLRERRVEPDPSPDLGAPSAREESDPS